MSQEPAGLLETLKAVLSGFFGVRRRAAHERAKLKPAYVIAIGLLVALLFILTLATVVHFVTS